MSGRKLERTLVLIKPDGIEKKLIGEVIKRIEEQGLFIGEIEMLKVKPSVCIKLYKNACKRIPGLDKAIIEYLTRRRIIAFIVEGEDAVAKVSKIRGDSDPSKSPPGSVRREFAGENKFEDFSKSKKIVENIMHSSSTKEEAEEEISLFFNV
jgi:nucleoside-diphosphate kinase